MTFLSSKILKNKNLCFSKVISPPVPRTVRFNTAFSTLRSKAPMREKKKFCASLNGSLILATWFIHVAPADIRTPINHAVRHAGRPRAPPGLTNPGAIFHLNNLALPQGRPTPETGHRREASLTLLVPDKVAHKGPPTKTHSPPRPIMGNCRLDIAGTGRRLVLWMSKGTQRAGERWNSYGHLIWNWLNKKNFKKEGGGIKLNEKTRITWGLEHDMREVSTEQKRLLEWRTCCIRFWPRVWKKMSNSRRSSH